MAFLCHFVILPKKCHFKKWQKNATLKWQNNAILKWQNNAILKWHFFAIFLKWHFFAILKWHFFGKTKAPQIGSWYQRRISRLMPGLLKHTGPPPGPGDTRVMSRWPDPGFRRLGTPGPRAAPGLFLPGLKVDLDLAWP